MIDKSKTYRTRDGREVRIYATDGFQRASIHGAYKDDYGRWLQHSWDEYGNCHNDSMDLIEVRPRHKRTVWLNVYPETDAMSLIAWKSKERADETSAHRIACIKVDLDFAEGDGL